MSRRRFCENRLNTLGGFACQPRRGALDLSDAKKAHALLCIGGAHHRLRLVEIKPRYGLSEDTLTYARSNTPKHCQGTDLIQADHAGQVDKEMDVTFVDERTNTAISVDVKRGGKLGDSMNKTLAKRVAAVSLTLRHHLGHADLAAARGEAFVLTMSCHAALRVPAPLALTAESFDARFGTDVSGIVRDVQHHYANRIAEALGPLARDVVRAMTANLKAPVASETNRAA